MAKDLKAFSILSVLISIFPEKVQVFLFIEFSATFI